ncbi:uncharacterized protein HD556DRAFT_1308714 [Suillus plorans]|uniref:Uncharacterized protein n=1 Tax=Suillus plorans TaxID=116603 RepID=A0A9P7ANX3_9AGAM|nr:uncharacterized protein HD556DRAFT_1308714 [Suillus plorans]KAG1793273.1 hypothetical protein HD556DRAFT_1308714 [Suillus plorans]
MSNSSASSATITAVAIFRFCEGQGRALIFDAQIYLVGFYIVIARNQVQTLVLKTQNERHTLIWSEMWSGYISGMMFHPSTYLTLSSVESIDDLTGTFSIDAHQYIHAYEATPPRLPEYQARWTKSGKKLMPQPHCYVSVTGFITGGKVKSVAGSEQTKRFTVEVDSIVFLGCPVVTKSLGNITSHGPSSSGTPSKPGMKFDFSQVAWPAKCQRTEEDIN